MDRPTVRFEPLILRIAARYKRRCWWADMGEMEQVGRIAAYRAELTYDPTVGVPEQAYIRRAVVLAIRACLWRDSVNVSGGTSDPRKLRGPLRRAPLETLDAMLELPGHQTQDPAKSFDEHRWKTRVRMRMLSLCARDVEALEGLRAMLSEEHASEQMRSARAAYKSRATARRLLMADPELWRMLKEKP